MDPVSGRLEEDADAHPGNHYGVYKLANEGSARIYWADSGVPSVGLRPMTVYGAGRDQGMTSSPTAAIAAAVLGVPFQISFGGRTLFQYAEDVAQTLILASRSAPDGPRVFNLGGSDVGLDEWVAGDRGGRPRGGRAHHASPRPSCRSRPTSPTTGWPSSATCRSRRTVTRSPPPPISTAAWPPTGGWSAPNKGSRRPPAPAPR